MIIVLGTVLRFMTHWRFSDVEISILKEIIRLVPFYGLMIVCLIFLRRWREKSEENIDHSTSQPRGDKAMFFLLTYFGTTIIFIGFSVPVTVVIFSILPELWAWTFFVELVTDLLPGALLLDLLRFIYRKIVGDEA